jgi:hypothetical protein
MNVVLASLGAAVITTEKPQDVDCAAVSDARHVTFVVPTGKALPDSGVQVVVTGAWPPLVIGAAQVTVTGWPSLDVPVALVGQAMLRAGGGGGGGVGDVGGSDPPHAAIVSARPALSPNSRQKGRRSTLSILPHNAVSAGTRAAVVQ